RADHERVVVGDHGGEIRIAVHVDVEARAEQLDARLGDRLPDEDLHARTVSAYASSARVTAAPRSIGAPRSPRTSSTAASAVAMSNTSNQPMCPMRKRRAASSPWPPATVMPKRSRRASTTP